MLISANSSCGADAGEEVEPRAGHLGAALDVDRAVHPAELDVVARLEVELRDLCRPSRARRSRPRHRRGPRRPRCWGCSSPRPATPPRRRPAPPRPSLTSAARVLVRASRSCFSSPWAWGSASRAASARPAWSRSRRSRPGGRRPPRAPGPRRRRRGRAWPGRHARGRGRLGARAGRSCGQRLSGAVRRPTLIRDAVSVHRDGILCDARSGADPKGAACSTVPAWPCSRGPPSASACSSCWPGRRPGVGGGPRLRRAWRAARRSWAVDAEWVHAPAALDRADCSTRSA